MLNLNQLKFEVTLNTMTWHEHDRFYQLYRHLCSFSNSNCFPSVHCENKTTLCHKGRKSLRPSHSAWASRDWFKLGNFHHQTIQRQPPHKNPSILNNQNSSTKESTLNSGITAVKLRAPQNKITRLNRTHLWK